MKMPFFDIYGLVTSQMVYLFKVRQILSLCPNITHLDLTQTDVTDFAFDR